MGKKTIWTHTTCGGTIDTKTRRCLKCTYYWNRRDFFLDPYGIRPVIINTPSAFTPYWEFIEKIPVLGIYATEVAKRLPNWPRWLRVISVVVVYSLLVSAIFFFIRGCLN